jgi:hypothetical protein
MTVFAAFNDEQLDELTEALDAAYREGGFDTEGDLAGALRTEHEARARPMAKAHGAPPCTPKEWGR